MLNEIIKWMREILETDIGITVAFILTVSDIYRRLRDAMTGVKKKPGIAALSLIGLIGIVLPVLILISCPWSGTLHIVLNCVALFAILNFFGLIYIIRMMSPFLKPTKL